MGTIFPVKYFSAHNPLHLLFPREWNFPPKSTNCFLGRIIYYNINRKQNNNIFLGAPYMLIIHMTSIAALRDLSMSLLPLLNLLCYYSFSKHSIVVSKLFKFQILHELEDIKVEYISSILLHVLFIHSLLQFSTIFGVFQHMKWRNTMLES